MTAIAPVVRRSYSAAGWWLRRCPGLTLADEPVTWYYAVTPHGRFAPGCAETIWSDSPLGALRKVLAHPSMRKR